LRSIAFENPRQHALADEGVFGFGKVIGVDGIVGALAKDLGAAVDDTLGAGSQVGDADGIPVVEGDDLRLEGSRVTGQVVDLGFSVDRVADLDCRVSENAP
jgi:hypothetical protein